MMCFCLGRRVEAESHAKPESATECRLLMWSDDKRGSQSSCSYCTDGHIRRTGIRSRRHLYEQRPAID